LYGPTGVGKTHVAQALGHIAIRHSADIRFAKVSRVLADLAGGSPALFVTVRDLKNGTHAELQPVEIPPTRAGHNCPRRAGASELTGKATTPPSGTGRGRSLVG
ncbi:MAG: ATP-binding protein, partial [Pseudonocardiaceae bacterium]